MANAPRGREKRVTDNGKGVARRGSGTGGGAVGRPSGGGGKRSGGSGGSSPMTLIIGLIVLLLGGGGGLSTLLGGDGGTTTVPTTTTQAATTSSQKPGQGSSSTLNSFLESYFGSAMSGYTTGSGSTGSYSSGSYSSGSYSSGSSSSGSSSSTGTNYSSVDTSVAKGARSKYTTIKGNKKDTTTIMIYMCGTDLESRSGMATNDLKEMAAATSSDNINIIIYTGGCSGWKINGISSSVNQIYQMKDGKLYCLEKNMGKKSMTDPATLTEFIKYCNKNYPANRNDLILWDHGGGSVSGYGYDQNFQSSGSMPLTGISKALKNAGIKFDFIGFDACLMATAENALMLDDYADYLIASEETEPGVGWYYTDWLTAYAKDPSMDTLTIGKNIIDTFVSECNRSCRGQSTTLSIIDLAEFAATVPEKLAAFAQDTTDMIKADDYTTVARARSGVREFAQSTKIDQIDLIDLCNRLNTTASKNLAKVLKSAVKYNKTSSGMTNAYGVSIYFPGSNKKYVDKAVSMNDSLGIDSEYNDCIKAFASVQYSGQSVATSNGATGNAFSSLSGSSSYSSTSGADLTSQILQALLSQALSNKGSYLSDRAITDEEIINIVSENQFDGSKLTWTTDASGNQVIEMDVDNWNQVTDLAMNMYYDDGKGYVDLGLDNVFSISDEGNLIGETDKTWLSINGQPVAYYYLCTADDGENYSITGYVPCYVNDERVNLLLTFDNEEPYGYIAGYTTAYVNGETDTIAKAEGELAEGDKVDFLCDYYTYSGEYQDTYYLGETWVYDGEVEISNTYVGNGDVLVSYKFTDLYGMEYWTETMK